MNYFSENKVFENPEVNCLLDRLYYFLPMRMNLYITGGLANILSGKKLPYPLKDIDFIFGDDETKDFYLEEIPNILGISEEDLIIEETRIIAKTKYIWMEFFFHQDRSFKEAILLNEERNIKLL